MLKTNFEVYLRRKEEEKVSKLQEKLPFKLSLKEEKKSERTKKKLIAF
jgi:hypothetical protein